MPEFDSQTISSKSTAENYNSHFSVESGNPDVPGATLVTDNGSGIVSRCKQGVNFAVAAPDATAMWLCLFDVNDNETRLEMMPSKQGVWHLLVDDIGEGQVYGFRAEGCWQPAKGLRYNPHKLLLDPVAREIKGQVNWQSALYDYRVAEEDNMTAGDSGLLMDTRDNARLMPRCVVRSNTFDWQGITPPDIPVAESIIYEVHLKGFTRLHPDIPEKLQGTYLGMCHPVVITYLKTLGINTVELLPVTAFVSEPRLKKLGLCNYWGYNPLVFTAPEPSYAVEDPVAELKTLVRELHRADIRVIMDVVFNHTCEGGNDGPSLNLRGLAAGDYYLLDQQDTGVSFTNYSGCGNTLNFDSSLMLDLALYSLRLWSEEYHIDGFRFDLAPVMGRKNREFDRNSPFFQLIQSDPVLSQRQLIAEPWDIGPGGYRLTGFPEQWQEWNDRYRDGIRAFWRGDNGRIADLAWRMTSSVDLFGLHRSSSAINYICSHDGFTLNDLVSYTERRNWENGENNRDGDQHNLSWNCSVEGETDNSVVRARRMHARKICWLHCFYHPVFQCSWRVMSLVMVSRVIIMLIVRTTK